MRAGPGAAVLDVGCGPATDTLPLARRVAPGGRVVGVDADPEMVAEAERRAAAAGHGAEVEHRVADALALPFPEAAFDAARCERLFLHLAEPERALAEMVRVVRPEGRVVVLDTDWGTRSVDAPEPELERRMARVLAEGCLVNGYSGRRLYGMAKRAGLRRVRADAIPLQVTDYALWRLLSRMEMAEEAAVRSGTLTPAEVERLDAGWRRMDAAGEFFAVTVMVVVAGERPGTPAGEGAWSW